uniref:Uncharacterized protein n=1 Tax=Grammatophora oceanica TaxID=210454 RepID=A0A6U5KDA1_9STRA
MDAKRTERRNGLAAMMLIYQGCWANATSFAFAMKKCDFLCATLACLCAVVIADAVRQPVSSLSLSSSVSIISAAVSRFVEVSFLSSFMCMLVVAAAVGVYIIILGAAARGIVREKGITRW